MDNRSRRLPNLPIDQGVLVRVWRAQVSGGLKDRKHPLRSFADAVAGVSDRATLTQVGPAANDTLLPNESSARKNFHREKRTFSLRQANPKSSRK